ncbi:CPBP family intramembrane glutamic endopeptidase [Dongshaea marina]|uniref:CPBP family intramembrane glutamic endopeptidase n=1 Tax=Dongshaea marina TaxID=2047966 RepID=UPI000D3E8D98|nr:CPBP family intramembrane glutamic endopeptidase [Dongshaea marina]
MTILLTPYLLLIMATLGLWFKDKRIAWGLFGLSVIAGLVLQRITWTGLLILLISVALGWVTSRKGRCPVIAWSLLLLLALASIVHLLPGFNNYLWLDNIHLSDKALPIRTWVNFDKPAIAFVILAFLQPFAHKLSEWLEALRSWAIMLPSILLMIAIGWGSGFIRPDLTLPFWLPLWALINLVLVCISEEVVFRGLLQGRLLTPVLGPKVALVVASLVFALPHYPGGPALVALAFVSGLFYGGAYLLKRRLEAAILLHFSLNMIHFIFFTYPAAR